jgi:hypothetical protein
MTIPVEEEIEKLIQEIKRLGTVDAADGLTKVKYGVLFKDDTVADTFEALMGTLKAAKKRKKITFEGELLLQGLHDAVDVVILEA